MFLFKLCRQALGRTKPSIRWVKVKVHPRTGHKGPKGKWRYSSTLSLTSVLDGDGWAMPRPSHFTPGKDPVPIVQEAGWATGLVWTGEENLAPTRFDPQTVQHAASRYAE